MWVFHHILKWSERHWINEHCIDFQGKVPVAYNGMCFVQLPELQVLNLAG